MTPAEKLSKSKKRAPHKRKGLWRRKTVWNCRIRELRESLRLSIREVCEACALSISALWEIEQGTDPQLTTARRLAEFFGVTVEALWPGQKE